MANNLFLDAAQLMLQADGLNYINYENLNQSNKEFLRSDTWDFKFTQPAAAVYFPGNDLLQARTISATPQIPYQLTQMTAIIRGFQINQTVKSGTTSGTISIDYNDLEDQSINAWLFDWADKCGDSEHRYAFRKEDTIAQGKLTIMNSSRKPLRIYSLLGMQIVDPGNGLNPALTSDDPQNVGMVSASFTFEHYRLDWKNF